MYHRGTDVLEEGIVVLVYISDSDPSHVTSALLGYTSDSDHFKIISAILGYISD